MMVYGVHAVAEALSSTCASVEQIIVRKQNLTPRIRKIVESARALGIPVAFKPKNMVHPGNKRQRHSEISARVLGIPYVSLERILERHPQLLLIVDGVQDPNNLGALMRTAEAVGVGGILIPRRHSCPVNSTVVTASAGAALHLQICRISNLSRSLEKLKKDGFWIVGLDPGGETTLDQINANLRLAVIVGGENRGLRRLVRQQCDFLVTLPMQGRLASLNLSVAAGILLYHIFLESRRRK